MNQKETLQIKSATNRGKKTLMGLLVDWTQLGKVLSSILSQWQSSKPKANRTQTEKTEQTI